MSLPILLFYGFSFIGIVHSIFFSFLAIKNKKPADLIITLFLFIQSLTILEYVFFWTGMENPYHYLCSISLTTQFLFGPLLLMYVDYVFYENKKAGNYIIHFIPAGVVFVLMLPYYFSNANLKLYHYKDIPYFILDLRMVVNFIMVHMFVYYVLVLYKILKVKRVGHIKNWLLLITGLFGLYITCFISYYVMVKQPWFTLTTDYFVSIGMCASIVAIIYFAYGKKKIMDGYPVIESLNLENIYFSYKETAAPKSQEKKKEQTANYSYPVTADTSSLGIFSEPITEDLAEQESAQEIIAIKYKNSGLTSDAGNNLAEALHILMQQEKLYRESELKLETLANKLKVAKHYVSQVINQHYGVNFFEYINLLRIEEAKQLLANPEKNKTTIIEVAYAVGYNTKNTFNTAFKRIAGVTPTEFRQQHKIRQN